jgi:hypothetical protein
VTALDSDGALTGIKQNEINKSAADVYGQAMIGQFSSPYTSLPTPPECRHDFLIPGRGRQMCPCIEFEK